MTSPFLYFYSLDIWQIATPSPYEKVAHGHEKVGQPRSKP